MLRKGFTLIELLIVIAILGILAVAVLSAINPLEQIKKARDAGRKSDAAELLNAHERYFSTWGCYSWQNVVAGCDTATIGLRRIATVATFDPGNTLALFNGDLITKQELKTQFSGRKTVTLSELYASQDATTNQLSVCFVPESMAGRTGGLGPVRSNANEIITPACAATYSKTETTCSVCVPQ